MKKRSRMAQIYGIIFLAIGLLWISAIVVRCGGFLPRKKEGTFSYQKIEEQLTEKIDHLTVGEYMPKIFIVYFRVIVCWEFACALFYLLAGLALLRAYPFRLHLAAGTVTADLLLKILIVAYQQYVLVPMKPVFQDMNILAMHFTPNAGLAAKISSCLVGIKLIQPGAFSYGFFYGLFLLAAFYVFSHPRMKKYF